MQYKKLNLIYFSATGTTETIIRAVASGIEIAEQTTVNLLNASQGDTIVTDQELTIFGVPVFSGRVPDVARKALGDFKGENAPAIVVCVYGNREFDDALIELSDLVEANGFVVCSAGAFIAQHSIFPKIAPGRPDASDLELAKAFGVESINALGRGLSKKLSIQGNRPYRPIKAIPLTPCTKRGCNRCGVCAKQCPTQAIDVLDMRKIDKKKCISCAHCIAVCPKKMKSFGGILYNIALYKFMKNYSERKEPYLIYCS